MNEAIDGQPVSRPPRILPEHLLIFTKLGLVGRALASGFLSLFGWVFLNIGLPDHNLSPLLVWTCIVVGFAMLRNLILAKVYCRVRVGFAVHRKLGEGVSLVFGVLAGMMIAAMFIPSTSADPRTIAAILGTGSVVIAAAFPIPPILSERGEGSLLFAQLAFEVKACKDLTQGLRWSDRGVRVLARVLKQYGFMFHQPTLRLGTRLYCMEKKDAKILENISQAILRLEDPDQFLVLKQEIETLVANGTEAISEGIRPRPRLEDYLDYRYLSLENVYRIVAIIAGILMIYYYCCWFLKLPTCPEPPLAQVLHISTGNRSILSLSSSSPSTILCQHPLN